MPVIVGATMVVVVCGAVVVVVVVAFVGFGPSGFAATSTGLMTTTRGRQRRPLRSTSGALPPPVCGRGG